MKNANIERLNAWAIDAHILDEAGVETLNELYIWLKAKKWDKE